MGENFIIIAQQVLVLFILIAVGFICGKKKIITDFSARAHDRYSIVCCDALRYDFCFSAGVLV